MRCPPSPDFLPLSQSRESLKSLRDTIHALTLYAGCSLLEAKEVTASEAGDFFNGTSFEQWKKGRDAELKIQSGIASRLNEVIRGIGLLQRVMGR
nr:MAG TPA: hypothetical protein [Caudoviricetes sp.]